jgi:hypothetical protein
MGELQIKGTEIAAAIGMTQGSFSRRYTGSAAWELDELEQLQQHFPELSIAYLLGLELDPGEPSLLTGPIMRIDPPAADPEQQQRAEYVTARPGNDRTLFTGPIAQIA